MLIFLPGFLSEQRQNPRVAAGDIMGLIAPFLFFFAGLF